MRKLIQHNIPEERHYLTRLLKLDLFEMKRARTTYLLNLFEGRLYGLIAAYQVLGIIDMTARSRYIEIIASYAYKRKEELANEV